MYAGRDGVAIDINRREVMATDKGIFGALAFGCMIAITILVILYRPTLRVEFQGAGQNITQEVNNGQN